MARITLNPLLSDIRKRSASAVFAKCLDAAYVKSHVKPTDPASAAQLAVRDTFSRMRLLYKWLPSYFKTQLLLSIGTLPLTPYTYFCYRNQSYEQTYRTQVFSTKHPTLSEMTLDRIFQRGPAGVQINHTYHGNPAGIYLRGWNRTIDGTATLNEFNMFQTGWFGVGAGYSYGPATPGKYNVYVLVAYENATGFVSNSVSTVWLQP